MAPVTPPAAPAWVADAVDAAVRAAVGPAAVVLASVAQAVDAADLVDSPADSVDAAAVPVDGANAAAKAGAADAPAWPASEMRAATGACRSTATPPSPSAIPSWTPATIR